MAQKHQGNQKVYLFTNRCRDEGNPTYTFQIESGKCFKKGRLALSSSFETMRVEELGERENLLEVVFRDGQLLKDYTFDEVKNSQILTSKALAIL